jgi:hypothetical protein
LLCTTFKFLHYIQVLVSYFFYYPILCTSFALLLLLLFPGLSAASPTPPPPQRSARLAACQVESLAGPAHVGRRWSQSEASHCGRPQTVAVTGQREFVTLRAHSDWPHLGQVDSRMSQAGPPDPSPSHTSIRFVTEDI